MSGLPECGTLAALIADLPKIPFDIEDIGSGWDDTDTYHWIYWKQGN